jgi:hypothetical protein
MDRREMPEDVRQKLGAAIVEVVKEPEAVKKLRAIGLELTGQAFPNSPPSTPWR